MSQIITIQAYEDNLQSYLQKHQHNQQVHNWLQRITKNLSKESKILEIGSGLGYDSDYLEGFGYNLTRSDVSDSFIKYQKSKKQTVTKFNAITDDSKIIFNSKFDLVFANAVFLHFDQNQFQKAIENISKIQNTDSRLCLTLKEGDFEGFLSTKNMGERFFKLWQKDQLSEFLKENQFYKTQSIQEDYTIEQNWLNLNLIRK